MPTFTENEKKFLTAVRAAVLDRGEDYVYDQSEATAAHACTYLNYSVDDEGKGGSCLIGRGILDAGLMTEGLLREFEGTNATIVLAEIVDISGAVSSAADGMQNQQDKGNTWGYSYQYGLDFLSHAGYDVSDLTI